jgi:hypothetical protein
MLIVPVLPSSFFRWADREAHVAWRIEILAPLGKRVRKAHCSLCCTAFEQYLTPVSIELSGRLNCPLCS